jgi:hypothetical protein
MGVHEEVGHNSFFGLRIGHVAILDQEEEEKICRLQDFISTNKPS